MGRRKGVFIDTRRRGDLWEELRSTVWKCDGDLAATCDGKAVCEYTIDTRTIGDPAFGCAKDYLAEWQCGNNPQKGSVAVGPEAGNGTAIVLRCPVR